MNIERFEAAAGGPFTYRHDGLVTVAPDPAALDFQHVLMALDLEQVPLTPRMPSWKRNALFGAWAAHYDLPTFRHAQRLAYLVDRYADALEYDLTARAGVDLGTLWRTRQWRRLLNAIDHLPRDCWYTAAISNDKEHAEMMAQAMSEQVDDGDKPTGPPLQVWDQNAAMLADLIDAVRNLGPAIIASQGGKYKDPPPYPRPRTALESAQRRVEFERRQAKHERLAMRILPHKRPGYKAPEAE